LRSGEFNCDTLVYQLFGLQPECDKVHDLAFWAGRVHPQDRIAVEQALQDCIVGIKPYDIEYRNVWDDGSLHHIRGSGKAIRDQKNENHDLQIALLTSNEHGVLLQKHVVRLSTSLTAEVRERHTAEEKPQKLIQANTREKGDLEILSRF
jgi:PAS domain-containing protein